MASPIPEPLEPDALAAALTDRHPDWDIVNGKLRRTLILENFAAAFGVMAEVAIHAERMHHHPEWSNVYNRLVIDLITHDAGDTGGITHYDLDLAAVIDAAAQRSS